MCTKVDVARMENDVVIRIGDALSEQPRGGQACRVSRAMTPISSRLLVPRSETAGALTIKDLLFIGILVVLLVHNRSCRHCLLGFSICAQ